MQGLGAQDIGSSTVCGRCRRGAEPFDLYLERFPARHPIRSSRNSNSAPPAGPSWGWLGCNATFQWQQQLALSPRAIQRHTSGSRSGYAKGEARHSTSFVLNAVANHTATLSADLASSRGTGVDDLLRLDCVDIDPMGPIVRGRPEVRPSTKYRYHRRPLPGIRSIAPQNLSNLLCSQPDAAVSVALPRCLRCGAELNLADHLFGPGDWTT